MSSTVVLEKPTSLCKVAAKQLRYASSQIARPARAIAVAVAVAVAVALI